MHELHINNNSHSCDYSWRENIPREMIIFQDSSGKHFRIHNLTGIPSKTMPKDRATILGLAAHKAQRTKIKAAPPKIQPLRGSFTVTRWA